MSNRVLTFLCILAALIFITGCSGTDSPKVLSGGSGAVDDVLTAGKIQGTVVAAMSKKPVSAAVIEAGTIQAISDEEGKYLLGPIKAGDYRVIARQAGFEVAAQDGVRVYQGKITENVNFMLNAAGKSHSDNFSIIALRPNVGKDGDIIEIYCNGCGIKPGQVTFNGKQAQIVDWNSTMDGIIRAIVPDEVKSGPVRVIIEGKSSNEAQLLNFTAKPHVSLVEPNVAAGGSQIKLIGRNFNPIPSFNHVQLGDQPCFVTSVSPGADILNVTLPVNAQTGSLTVEIRSDVYTLECTGSALLTVIPKLVHIAPKRALPSTDTIKPIISIYGYNFGKERNAVKVIIGKKELNASDFLIFSDNKISFYAPTASVVSPGTKQTVKVRVNNAESNSLDYAAYNSVQATLADKAYGIYDFDRVSSGGTFKLSVLRPTEKLVFISVLSGNSLQSLNNENQFVLSSYMGGNYRPVPALPNGIRGSYSGNLGLSLREPKNSRYKYPSCRASKSNIVSSSIRESIEDPAQKNISVYIRDFNSDEPWKEDNDILATGTLIASGSKSLVYYDINQSGLSLDDAKVISKKFDDIYSTLTLTFGIKDPPEGNVDAQKRIVLFMTPLLEKSKASVMSYIDPRDTNPVMVHSAGTEIIYASSSEFDADRNEFFAELAANLHKLFYRNQKSASGVYYGTDWLEAGLGCVAREKAGYGYAVGHPEDVLRVNSYLGKPYAVSLTDWPSSPKSGNFGMQYLFNKYLCQRCKGKDPIISLEGTSGGRNLHKGLADVENLLGKAGIIDFNGFFEDFALAMYCDGLGLDTALPGYSSQYHQFDELNLRNGNVGGLRGGTLGESPFSQVMVNIKGNSCIMYTYQGGNWGDIETSIQGPVTEGRFKTWVIYISAKENIIE